MKYQVQENYLTIFLPGELDHHNAEEIRKESCLLYTSPSPRDRG